jgi:DNA mismatch repair protein MLH3
LDSKAPVHGGRGTFIASLSAISLLSITSHHHMYRSHNTLSMHKSEVVSRQIPAPAQQHLVYSTHGTRVTVRDLFGSMPVRVKQRAIVAEKQRGYSKEWEELKREIVGLLLSWPTAVSVTVREASSNQKFAIRSRNEYHAENLVRIDIPSICSILSQASFTSAEDNASWVSVCASMPTLDINGTISLEPSPTKHLQFISFGIQPLVALDGQSILHDEINRLFSHSAFGNEEEAEDLDDSEQKRRANDRRYKGDGHTHKELKGGKKGVDRWPMFYIKIQQTLRSKLEVDDILDDRASNLTSILELLQAMIFEFLTRHHFRPKTGRRVKFDQNTTAPTRNITTAASAELLQTDPGQLRSEAEDLSSAQKMFSQTVTFDPLLTNIKLPSFRRPVTQIDSTFDGWTRIKTSSSALRSTAAKGLLDNQLASASEILRPFTAPPYSKGDVAKGRTSNVSLARRPSTPLLSKSGKLVRRPFQEVISKPQPRAHKPHTRQQERQETGPQSNDDMIYWMNPVTKKESLVNQRTGLTIPATRSSKNSISKRIMGTEPGTFSSRTNLTRTINTSNGEPSPWLSNILKTWDNPIFLPTEKSIPQVSLEDAYATTQEILHGRHHHCSQIDIDKAFRDSSAGVSGRISKDALKAAEVVSQVDKKFILIKVTPTVLVGEDSKTLILIDQHAADERIRIEALMEELCSPPVSDDSIMSSKARIMTSQLDKPLVFEVPSAEIELLQTHEQHFANWGILYDFPPTTTVSEIRGVKSIQRLTVRCLPPGITERCKIEPRLLIDLVRTEVHKVSSQNIQTSLPPTADWLQRIHTCPQGIIDMLNSRACRSAIMFNDELSKEQCEVLVRRLAGCKFPFQCAHGRPSLVPLVDLGRLKMESISTSARGKRGGVEDGFGRNFQRWKASIMEQPVL